ncbi:hypothetical protein IV203_005434 [Nitzschia inconspicua]|uniref:Uncharacterized protein n=1 Tax=Nitzschia inconspicua TaxID=303405 RepID=A0A9K3KMX9_9STRA|nr:hypothetical protein IV203_005434 [Nitzschia inconspicua]
MVIIGNNDNIQDLFFYVAVAECSFIRLDYGSNINRFNQPDLGMFNMALFDEGGKPHGCVPQNCYERFKDAAFDAGRALGSHYSHDGNNHVCDYRMDIARDETELVHFEVGRFYKCLYGIYLLCQLIMFSAFGSPVCKLSEERTFGNNQPIPSTCGPGVASILGALNVILFIGLTVLVWLVPGPIHPYFIRWADDDNDDADDMGTDDHMDDLLGDEDVHDIDNRRSDRELGKDNHYWSSDDHAALSDSSGVYDDPTANTYSDENEAKKRTEESKKKHKKGKKKKEAD